MTLLIPAIDLKDGQCVRLKQGRMDDATVFSDDPVAMAQHWRDQGCRRLHIVDLDGAFAGEPRNKTLIENMVKAIPGVAIQVGGGVRTLATIGSYLEAGVDQVIVGTRAVEEPAFLEEAASRYPSHVTLGLDAKDGYVATEGWDVVSEKTAIDFAQWASGLDIAGIVYTDIARDGMLTGPNVEATLQLALATPIPVIASGGVSTLDDLSALKAAFAKQPGDLFGVITGRAIYAGTLDFRSGQALLDS
ncbi:MAG: 1-(5-phosphoribosyl)-5-[(5-phosphoribosylamino)methylideneamino]imidazole-4-carboxamide isomerase [Pseudomonadales bacterium]